MDKLDKNYLYLPFDTYKRNIASIIYIPNSQTFKTILDKYDFAKNDMDNFEKIKLSTGLIQNFPIFPSNFANTGEESYVSENLTDKARKVWADNGVESDNAIANRIVTNVKTMLDK